MFTEEKWMTGATKSDSMPMEITSFLGFLYFPCCSTPTLVHQGTLILIWSYGLKHRRKKTLPSVLSTADTCKHSFKKHLLYKYYVPHPIFLLEFSKKFCQVLTENRREKNTTKENAK